MSAQNVNSLVGPLLGALHGHIAGYTVGCCNRTKSVIPFFHFIFISFWLFFGQRAGAQELKTWGPGDNLPSIPIADARLSNGGGRTDWLKTRENAVILVHGANPEGAANPFSSTSEWRLLSASLIDQLNRSDLNVKWAVFPCNWAQAAATGIVINYVNSPGAATRAAKNARKCGVDYGRSLNQACPNLRRVQFIAHSAGSWLARDAIEQLLTINPHVVCQLTLLDAYVPGNLPRSLAGWDGDLSQAKLQDIAQYERVWNAQNIYVDDFTIWNRNRFSWPTAGTAGDFNWDPIINDNFRLDRDGFLKTGYPYDYHSGPVLFYAHSTQAIYPGAAANSELQSVEDWQEKGASTSFWMSEGSFPKISSQSQTRVSRVAGQTARLQVNMTFPVGNTFRWWRLEPIPYGKRKVELPNSIVSNQLILDVPITSGMKSTEYICEITGVYRMRTFSSVFTVSEDLGSAPAVVPSVVGISPSAPSADSAASHLVTITGKNFVSSPASTVTLVSPSGVANMVSPTVNSSSELELNYTFTGQPGLWSVVVKNGTSASNSISFRVTSSTPVAVPRVLSSISIENLPGTIFEGQTASNVRIKRFYSDGTDSLISSATSANWNVQYSALSFFSPSTFTAAQVTSDTFATVTATYSEGGITKSYQSQITVLNNTSTGGVVTGEIVKNGTFGSNGMYWSNTNEDFHITSDYSFGGHTGGYAWMATPAGGQGNNLKGSISQVIDLPSNASALSLKFSCAISVQNTAALTTADNVIVRLTDENGSNPVLLKIVNPVGNPEASGQWAEFSVDLTPYKGTRKSLIFGGNTDYSNPATLRVDDVRVEITAGTPTLVDLAITGPDVVKEGTVSPYNAVASYSTGVANEVTTSATWSVNENATISGGTLTAQQVIAQRTARITASYSSGGITKSVSKDVTILDTAPVPVSLAIYGPSQVDENSGGTFSAVMLLSTGVYQEVSSSTYWSFTGTGGQVDPIGRLYTNEVAADTVLTVKASYEKDGVTVTAETPLTILDRLPPVLPSSMAIVGPSSVDEAGTGLFDTEVTYADGSKKFVSAFWQENSRFTTISEHGVLACEEVLTNQVVTLSASFTENSNTVNATKNVTIANTLNTIAKPEIIMPAFMEIPVDRVANLRLQTAHPVVAATATGLPPGLTFNSSTFEIQGTPSDVGTWEIQLSATNDFGSTTGTLLLTVSEDSGPEWIRFTKAEVVTVPTIGITSDGEGGCYLYGYNSVAHRNGAGVIDFNTGPMGVQIDKASGSPNGFAVTGRFDATFTVGGRTINKFPNGEGEAVVIVFNKAGQALWHDTAHSTYKNVNAGAVTLNSDGSLFWAINYFASVGFQTLGVGLEQLNPAIPGQGDCAVIKINPNYTFAWGHRWGGNQYEEILEIAAITAFSCRVKISSSSSSLIREAMQYQGLFTTSWNKGNSPGQWRFIETVFERGGFADAQLDSPDYDAFPADIISDPVDYNRFWVAGNFRTSAPFKRFNNGLVFENILLPAASTGKTSGFVIKSGFSTQTSSTALFRSLAPTDFGLNEVYTSKLAPMSDGSVLSIGTYSPSFDYNGTRFLDNPQDYGQNPAIKRAFISGHDANNNMKWVLACGGANGGIPTALENVGNDKWVMLCSCSGDAKFGRLPVIPGGGLIMVDIERKTPLPEIPQVDEKWHSYGFTAGEFSKLRAGGATNDLFSLSTDQGDLGPAFDPTIHTYSKNVSHDVSTIKFLPIAYSSSISVNGSTVVPGSASQSIPLVVGRNEIAVTVTAQDGVTTKIYSVTVTRVVPSILALSGLELNHGLLSPGFANDNTNYTVKVANTVSSLAVTATVSEATATLKINNIPVISGNASPPVLLMVGSNTITVTVTGQDGVTTKIYTVTVTRAAVSTLALSGLEVSDGLLTPEFAADNTNYTVKVANTVSSILVIGAVSDATANVKVNGILAPYRNASVLVSLNVGSNTINVKVTAKDGTTNKTYTILVTRAPLSGAFLQGLSVKGVGMNPKFKSTTTNYTATVGKATAKIKLTATATPTGTAIKVNGVAIKSGSLSKAIPLKVGKNTIKIVVAAQDGNTKTYKIIVTRSSAAASSLKSVAIVPSAESAMIIASAPEIARTTMVMIGGCKYLQLTMQKEDPAVRRIVEVSPNLIDWFSGDRHTTVLVDNRTILSVRDNTPTTAGAKRYIRVRTVRN